MKTSSNTSTTATTAKKPAEVVKSRRGFAAMDPEQQRRIAREGGKASHESGRGHRFTTEEARNAGRKGGLANRGRSTMQASAR